MEKFVFCCKNRYLQNKGVLMNKRKLTFILLAVCVVLCVIALVIALVGGGEETPGENDESSTVQQTEQNTYAGEPGDIEIDISELW